MSSDATNIHRQFRTVDVGHDEKQISAPQVGKSRLSVVVIVPVYNQRATIVEAIDSVLAQTRPADEIIVVDDGSTDGSGDLVTQKYGNRVCLIRQANLGAGAARNAGICTSRSDLLTFLDADDGYFPGRLERQVAFMEEMPTCMMSFSAAVLRDEVNNLTAITCENIDKRTYLQRTYFQEESLPAANSVMLRREVVDHVGVFDESLRKCQDTDLWLRIMIRFGFEHIPEPLVWVRRGPHQTAPANLGEVFFWHDRYFLKHKYTFGRGFRGQVIWRRAYSSVMRREVVWYFRHGQGRNAFSRLLHSVWIWPLFDSSVTFQAGLEYLLGSKWYDRVVWPVRILIRPKGVLDRDH